MSNIYIVDEYNIEVITKFKNGTRVKFTVPYKTFKRTLENDNNTRLDLWMHADNDKPHYHMYKLIDLKLDSITGKIKQIEIIPECCNEEENV